MLALLDGNAPPSLDHAVREIGYTPLRLPPHPLLPPPIAAHPDMLLFFAPNAIYCTKSYSEIACNELSLISKHCQKEILALDADYGSDYPRDVLLNALSVGEYLICHPRATARELTSLYSGHLLAVAQGYAKCSAVPLGDRALITADPSIASAATAAELDVLRICEGHIRLKGYSYGFIGGCASASPYQKTDTVYFCGNINAHPNAIEIVDFCDRHGYRVLSLGELPLTDVGTVFLL